MKLPNIVITCCTIATCSCTYEMLGEQDLVDQREQEVFNGTDQSGGVQEALGVVMLDFTAANGDTSSCTGTLLANQYVSTARHCVRNYADPGPGQNANAANWWGPIHPTIQVTHERNAAPNQTTLGTVILEGPNAFLPENDYVVLQLDSAFEMAGSTANWWRHIYASAGSTLNGVSVNCFGYGLGVYAVPPSGGQPGTLAGGKGILRSATLTIDQATAVSFRVTPNSDSQISGPGDSGGTCFLDDFAVGIASNGPNAVQFDINGDGSLDGRETVNMPDVFYTSPESYRNLVEGTLTSPAPSVTFRFVPPLPSASASLNASVSTPRGTLLVGTGTGANSRTFQPSNVPVRSGHYSVLMTEPSRYLCRRLTTVAPTIGNVPPQVGACLSDGLLPVVL